MIFERQRAHVRRHRRLRIVVRNAVQTLITSVKVILESVEVLFLSEQSFFERDSGETLVSSIFARCVVTRLRLICIDVLLELEVCRDATTRARCLAARVVVLVWLALVPTLRLKAAGDLVRA